MSAERCLRRSCGFTLIEIVVVLTLLATVLTVSYQILTNVLETERVVARLSTPEKIGQGILSMLRRDLLGVIYHDLGERVFQVYDNGEAPTARDEAQFITTVPPIFPETLSGQLEGGGSDAASPEGYSTVTAVNWYLKETPLTRRAAGVLTLFRRENVAFQGPDPFTAGGGTSYEIYDKVRGINIECFDGVEWFPFWDSQSRLALEVEEESLPEGIPIAKQPGGQLPEAEEEDLLGDVPPPAAVPVAVRISITILAGDEKGLFTGESTFGEFKEYTFTTMVPILSAMRIPLSSEDELSQLEGVGEPGVQGEERPRAGDGGPPLPSGGREGSSGGRPSSGTGRGGRSFGKGPR